MMLISLGVFIAGSVACALAPTMTALILGARAAGHRRRRHPAARADRDRRPVVAARAAADPELFVGDVPGRQHLGPVLGGVLTDYVHWSLIFWINVPLGVVALVMTDRALRRLPRNERPHRLDMVGAALMVAAAIALLLALGWGGVRYRWASPEILVLLGGSALLWGCSRCGS